MRRRAPLVAAPTLCGADPRSAPGASPGFLRLAKFTLVGLLGATLQIVLLRLLTTALHLPVLAATPFAVELILLHNFAWHENFTWRDRRYERLQERIAALARFHLSNGAISLFGNTALMYLFVDRFRMPVALSAALAIVLCGVLNFLFADRLVYREGGSKWLV